jgi:hypothetical protein
VQIRPRFPSSYGRILSAATGVSGGLSSTEGLKIRDMSLPLERSIVSKGFRSLYHPAANRMVERGHKPITGALAKLSDGGLGNWVRNLLTVLFADRTSIHQPTGWTPF